MMRLGRPDGSGCATGLAVDAIDVGIDEVDSAWSGLVIVESTDVVETD
jgi:hypothetical protein